LKCNSGSRYAGKKHLSGGAYVNFMMEEGEERVKASYWDNYERLVAIKGKYDPTNFFRVNQNIKSTI
jgi:FAD/FMN-containing dehydrogenase